MMVSLKAVGSYQFHDFVHPDQASGLQTHGGTPGFYVGAQALNSGLQTGTASTFPTKSSLQLKSFCL